MAQSVKGEGKIQKAFLKGYCDFPMFMPHIQMETG
jgi:hypothetical protein